MHAPAATLSPADTADALVSGAVLRWWQTTGFLEVAGPDAASFLDGLCTQAVERIEPGHAVLGLFLDAKAKIIAPAVLHRVDDAPWRDPRTEAEVDPAPRLLVETLPDLVEPLQSHLKKYRLRAKATLEPIELSTVALVGAELPSEPPTVEDGTWTRLAEQARPTLVFLGSADACAELVNATSVPLADPDALEADRIEHRVAGLHDLLVGRMPAEVGGMDAAVALDAGCYLGQEPVARLHYRGHANRTLRRLAADGPLTPNLALSGIAADPDAPFALQRAGDDETARPAGRVTTWASRPDGTVVALAVLRREVAPDEPLRLAGTVAPTLVARDAAPE